jgi:hypothetical protein
LRDASLTVRALLGLGCADEAEAFINWLLHSTRLTRPELRILYDIYGIHPGKSGPPVISTDTGRLGRCESVTQPLANCNSTSMGM